MDIREILSRHSIRITQHRCDVLEYFIHSKGALSATDLERIFENRINRVSIYRMLQTFSERKVLCKLIDSKGTVSYVFDNHSLQNQSHFHPHYKCKYCNDVVELPELPDAYMQQLIKFNIDELNILAEGTCKECEKDNKIKCH